VGENCSIENNLQDRDKTSLKPEARLNREILISLSVSGITTLTIIYLLCLDKS